MKVLLSGRPAVAGHHAQRSPHSLTALAGYAIAQESQGVLPDPAGGGVNEISHRDQLKRTLPKAGRP